MDFALFHPSKIPHYNRVIDICCFLFMFVNMGIASTTFNVFLPAINALPEMSDTLGSLVIAARMLTGFISTFIVVAYYRVFDCRFGITLACLSTALAFFLYSISTTFPMFCVASLFCGFSYGLGGLVGTTMIIGRWFKNNQGIALGVATSGSGAAAMILPFISTWIIENSGLAPALQFNAVISLVIGIIVYLLLRNHPKESLTITLFHAIRNPKEHFRQNASSASDSVKTQLLKNSTRLSNAGFYLMMLAIMLMGIASIGSNMHLAVLLRTNGFDPLFVAAMLSLSGLMLLFSKIVAGVLFDKAGSFVSTALLGGTFAIGLVILCFVSTGSPIVAIIAVSLVYLGQTISSMGLSKWSLDMTIPQERANTAQTFQMCYTFGSFIGTLFPGFFFDVFGSYIISYVIFCCTLSVCTVIVCRTYRSLR